MKSSSPLDCAVLFWIAVSALPALAASAPHQATGVKVGEITPTSAVVWTRLTAAPVRNQFGPAIEKSSMSLAAMTAKEVAGLAGACPGMTGQIRVRFGTREDLRDATATDWADVSAETDFTHPFQLTGLKPGARYYYAVDTTGPGGKPEHGSLYGRFQTAPAPEQSAKVTFCVVTGLMYRDLDDGRGYNIFAAMDRLAPQFVVFTGDSVYYDNEPPRAENVALARYHWERMFSLPRHVDLLRHTGSYWEKDDHDVLQNDCWPTLQSKRMGRLTFAEGQTIFRQQTPVGPKLDRTFRWGRHLQIWLTEGRDFRSPNTMPDGPDKTIWGAEQKAWLKRTLLASDATWKVLVNATPIVGPDRGRKNDNLANQGFAHEGNEMRHWFQAHLPEHFFIACGDRHWQYHSIHPETRVQEFSCGPASNEHAGGTPGRIPGYHQFHRVKGGFLSVTVTPQAQGSRIAFRFHDVHGLMVYEWAQNAAPSPRRQR